MKGLENPGSLCYLLSLMQQYQSLPPVRALFLELNADEDDWIANETLEDMLLSVRKAMKREKRQTDDEKTRKLFTKRKRLVDFVLQFQRVIAHCAASDSSDDDESSSTSSNEGSEKDSESSSSRRSGGDSDEDSDEDDVSIVPLYTVIQKLTNDKVKLNKPRDCADFFSKVCKLFTMITQDKVFQTQYGSLVTLAKAFLTVFQGFVQHRISPVEWPHPTEDPSIVQTDPFYYLSIDISPGDLLLSLERYSLPSTPFPFSWTEPNGQRSMLLSTKCDQLIRKQEPIAAPTATSSANTASATAAAAAAAVAAAAMSTEPVTREAVPSVLALHLRRFAIDLDAQWKEKLLDFFSFPYQLDLAPFLTPVPVDAADLHRNEPPPPSPLRYQLHGVIVHAGDAADDGHYVSLIRNSSSSGRSSFSCSPPAWYLCNDDRIRRYVDPPASVATAASAFVNGNEPIEVAEWLRPWFGENSDNETTAVAGAAAAPAAQPTPADDETAPEPSHTAVAVDDDDSDASSSSSSSSSSMLDDAVAMMLFYVRIPSSPTDDAVATT